MSVETKATLKSYFATGAKPTQAQFENLIDTLHGGYLNLAALQASTKAHAEGEIVIAGQYRFRVAPSGASDHVLTTAGGVKLYSEPFEDYVAIAAPVPNGTVPEQIFSEGSGLQTIAMAPYFTGTVTSWIIAGNPAATIHPTTGVVTVNTDDPIASTQIVVTGSNAGGAANQPFQLTVSDASPAPVITSAGAATGTAQVGSRVYVPDGAFTGTGVTQSFQWTRNGSDIAGATQHNYVPQIADIGATIARRWTVSNTAGSDVQTSTGITCVVYEHPVEFDPIYKNANVTIATATTAGTTSDALGQVRCDRWWGQDAPKFYCEFSFPGATVVSNFAAFGVAPFHSVLNHGTGTASAVTDWTFARINGGVGAPTGFGDAVLGAFWDRTNGDTVRLCVDMSAGTTGKIWFGNKTTWNGDPDAGTGGFDLPDFERLCLHIGPRTLSSAVFTLRTKAADLQYAIPTGAIPMAQVFTTLESTTVAKADDMVERTACINGHLNRRGELWGQPSVWKPFMADLGIRYVRTLLASTAAAFTDANSLVDTYGVKGFLVRLVENNGGTPGSYNNTTTTNFHASAIANLAASRILGVEGPNEFNKDNNPNNALNAYNAQKHLFSIVNAGSLADKPIVGPTTWSRSEVAQDAYAAAAVADSSTADATMDNPNLHHYMPGTRPSDGITLEKNPLHMNRVIAQIKKDTGAKPMWVTEFGVRCFDPPDAAPDNQTPSADMAANYGLRGLIEFFNSSVPYVFWYNLFDDETTGDNYGLMRHDTANTNDLVKRPAYFAFKRFWALLSNPASFTPSPLRYNLTGNLSNVKNTMLQKSNGKYFLILFNDEMTWDTVAHAERTVPDRPVKLGLAKRASSIIEHRPTFTDATTQVATNAFEVTLSVPDEVAVYEITLG